MRLPSLRRTLIDLVIATAPLAAFGGCFDDDPCRDYVEIDERIVEPPPAALVMLVRACEADAEKCVELCAAVIADGHGPNTVQTCHVEHDAGGHDVTAGYLVYNGNTGCPVDGRRPAGLANGRGVKCSGAARHLARAAWFEGASVHAFVRVARELQRHGAPVALQRAARQAALDEVLHTRLIGDLARARGGQPPEVVVELPTPRSIESLAIENATEGVVGETWAALIATWQAHHAPDAAMRAIYKRVAEDETRHADLARAIDAWAKTRLTKPACRRVERARLRALGRLATGVRRANPATLVRDLGLPDALSAATLFDRARAQIWA